VLTSRFFNEFAFETTMPADQVLAALEKHDVIGGVRASRLFPDARLDNVIVAAATECTTEDDIKSYAAALAEVLK
jgi:glycine dehydrogenase subunit 1